MLGSNLSNEPNSPFKYCLVATLQEFQGGTCEPCRVHALHELRCDPLPNPSASSCLTLKLTQDTRPSRKRSKNARKPHPMGIAAPKIDCTKTNQVGALPEQSRACHYLHAMSIRTPARGRNCIEAFVGETWNLSGRKRRTKCICQVFEDARS